MNLKTGILKTTHSFVKRLFITMTFKLAIGAFHTAANKGIVLKKGLPSPFCWSNVHAYHFHSLLIWKGSNMNGQRFHKQKRIETKVEQWERGLGHVGKGSASLKMALLFPCTENKDLVNDEQTLQGKKPSGKKSMESACRLIVTLYFHVYWHFL